MRKRLLSVLTTAAMLCVLLTQTAAAEVGCTVADAVAWAKQQLGRTLGTDSTGLIEEYYDFLGSDAPDCRAAGYAGAQLPEGWTRVYSGYRPGDIAVWEAWHSCATCSTGEFGNIGIITAVSGDCFTAVSRSFLGYTFCTESSFALSAPVCAIRPQLRGEGQHIHEYAAEVHSPGCTDGGYTVYTCSCGDSFTDNVTAPTGHTETVINAVASGCTASGYSGDTVCSVCGTVLAGGNETPPKGHDYSAWETISAATCTADGVRVSRCTRCGDEKQQTVKAQGHIYRATVTVPTCTEPGLKTFTCRSCGESYSETAAQPRGHRWDKGTVSIEPTYGSAGERLYLCTVCGAVKTESIPALEREPEKMPFRDVSPDSYCARAVLWAYDNGITGGVDGTHFAPDSVCTRAHVVTFLWRTEGEPQPTLKKSPFKDVREGTYYYKAVLWAVENGIVSGYADGTFRPAAACTRAHVVTFLWRYRGRPAVSGGGFSDTKGLSRDFASAISWAASKGITTGYSDGSFRPGNACTRGHVVTFLWRYMEKPT